MDDLMPPPPTPIEALCEQAGLLDYLEPQRVREWLRREVERRRREQAAGQAELHAMQDRAIAELDRRLERLVDQ